VNTKSQSGSMYSTHVKPLQGVE